MLVDEVKEVVTLVILDILIILDIYLISIPYCSPPSCATMNCIVLSSTCRLRLSLRCCSSITFTSSIVLVDEVKEVVTLDEEHIEKMGYEKDEKERFLSGVGKTEGRLISLLDITSVLADVMES